MPTRRRFLANGLAAAAVWPLLGTVRAATFDEDPFTLGVASGWPRPQSVVLWTRLTFPAAEVDMSNPFAPVEETEHGPLDVEWQIAEDEGFASIVQSGIAEASPDFAHSVHVEVQGLRPDRWYFYRFRAGNAQSPVGRTKTAPALDAAASPFRFAFASCQQYEQGYYAPYRDMAERDLDLVVHLGDYMYEMTWGAGHVRDHGTGAPSLLYEYRDRYALYKSDENLKAAHAAFPWLLTWDDHEVYNNYLMDPDAGEKSRQAFLERRRTAYQAWYEHMPVPPSFARDFSSMRIYGAHKFGRMLDLAMLDLRQYRTPPETEGDVNVVRSILGADQEAWLDETLEASTAKWTIVGQQTLISERDLADGEAERFSPDTWDGYRASRRKLLESIAASDIANPLVIGGDLHAYFAADVKMDFADEAAPTLATEFVTGSISSDGPTERSINTILGENPHIKYADGNDHGYAMVELTEKQAKVDFMVVSDRKDPNATTSVAQSFVVADGMPGVVRA